MDLSDQEFELALVVVQPKVRERLGNSPIVEDVVQEVALRAWKKRADLESEEQLMAYMYVGASQELRRTLAREGERKRLARSIRTLNTIEASSTTQLEIAQACEGLSESLRQAVMEVLLDGSRLRECALPKDQVHRAVQLVKARLRKD